MAEDIAKVRGTIVGKAKISVTDLQRLIQEGKITVGDLMRELRLRNRDLEEIAKHLRPY